MLQIAVITGTTRPGTKAPAVANWVIAQARNQMDAEFTVLDIADFNLPLLDEADARAI